MGEREGEKGRGKERQRARKPNHIGEMQVRKKESGVWEEPCRMGKLFAIEMTTRAATAAAAGNTCSRLHLVQTHTRMQMRIHTSSQSPQPPQETGSKGLRLLIHSPGFQTGESKLVFFFLEHVAKIHLVAIPTWTEAGFFIPLVIIHLFCCKIMNVFDYRCCPQGCYIKRHMLHFAFLKSPKILNSETSSPKSIGRGLWTWIIRDKENWGTDDYLVCQRTERAEAELECNIGSLVAESVQRCLFSENENRGHTHWNKAKVRKNGQVARRPVRQQLRVSRNDRQKRQWERRGVRDTGGKALSHTKINDQAFVMPLK